MTKGLRALVVAVAILGCVVWVPAVGADTPTGAISGVVTDAVTGQPLADVLVDVSDSSGDGAGAGLTCTAADGSYTVSDLPTASYSVQFQPGAGCSGKGPVTYMAQQLSSSVTAPETTTGVDAALSPAGAISGTVTDVANGAPVSNVQIELFTSSGSAGDACTDQNGNYVARGLPAGSYLVEYTAQKCVVGDPSEGDVSGFADQWYPQAGSQASAQPVSVTTGAITSGIDGALTEDASSSAGMIAGTVTDASDGQPAGEVAIELDKVGTGQFGGTAVEGVGSACTSASGTYVLSGLPPGSYDIVFASTQVEACGDPSFLPQVYKDIPATLSVGGPEANLFGTTTPVSVSAGTTTTAIDGDLTPGATISGTLTQAAGGQPAAKTLVVVYDSAGNPVGSACSSADGTYTTTVLPSGSYRVGFSSDPQYNGLCTLFTGTYLPQYYASATSLASATPVTLQAPTNLTGVDGSLVQGATITGNVTPSGSSPLDTGFVEVLNSTGAVVASTYAAGSAGPGKGSYTVGGLPVGDYTVRFSAQGYETQYYAATPVASAATPVQLTSGSTASGIDATLVPDSQTGAITGTVMNASTRQPVPGITVDVADPGGPLQGTATTGPDGSYSITGVPAGKWDVAFVDPTGRYLTQLSADSATPAGATPVTVTGGGTLSGIDAALAQPSTKRRVALISPATVTATRAGALSLRLACPGTAVCSGRVGIAPVRIAPAFETGRNQEPSLASAQLKPFSVKTGRTTTVRFRLSRTLSRGLVRRHQTALAVMIRDGTGTRHYVLAVRLGSSRRRS